MDSIRIIPGQIFKFFESGILHVALSNQYLRNDCTFLSLHERGCITRSLAEKIAAMPIWQPRLCVIHCSKTYISSDTRAKR